MKKIFRNIMTLMTVPFMLMTSACESMDDTNVDPTRMNTANAGSFFGSSHLWYGHLHLDPIQ